MSPLVPLFGLTTLGPIQRNSRQRTSYLKCLDAKATIITSTYHKYRRNIR